jgi:GT2 family glycosyltransferase
MIVIVAFAESVAARDADGRAFLGQVSAMPRGSRVVLLGADGQTGSFQLDLPDGVECIAISSSQALDDLVSQGRAPGLPSVSGLHEGWAARQLLHCLQQLEREFGAISHVQLPCMGAAAFWLLQERAVRQAFLAATVAVRLTALTTLEAARKGRALATDDLLRADMERRCLLDCDLLLAENDSIAVSMMKVAGVDAGRWEERLRVAAHSTTDARLPRIPPAIDIACVVSEPAALRQCVRALIGYLQEHADYLRPVLLCLTDDALNEGLGSVPNSWRHRFRLISPQELVDENGAAIVVFADRWSASADQARIIATQGRRCLVNASNPAFAESVGWGDGRVALRYQDTAHSMGEGLRRMDQWQPKQALVSSVDAWLNESCHVGGAVRPVTTLTPPLVTVIVPYFNLGAYLPATLESLRACRYDALEVLVVDDGSTERESIELLASLDRASVPGLRILRLPFNQGLAAARNAGLAAAAGKYVLTLDADDLIAPGFIGEAVAALERLSGIDFVVPQAAYFDDVPDVRRFEDVVYGDCIPLIGEAWQSGLYANRYSTATCLGRRDTMRAIGYDESLRSYEDWEFYRRALANGHRFVVTSDVNFLYRRRADSMIHAPEMRRRHAQLVAEMGARTAIAGERTELSLQAIQVVAAPFGIPGDPLQGLLLAETRSTLDEMARLRRSRVVGVAYRVSAALSMLRGRLRRLRR